MSGADLRHWFRDDGRRHRWLVVAVALAASITGIGNLFAYDDIPILVENPMVTGLHSPWAYLTDSYWGPSRGNALYRPLTVIAYALEWAIGKGSPFPFHAANILLYAACAGLVHALFRCFVPALPALVGALLWAAHPVHVEAVANVVGQSEMLTAIPMLIAVAAYVRDRMQGALRGRTIALVAACVAWALLHKEHGIVLPALLVAAEAALLGHGFVSRRAAAEGASDRGRGGADGRALLARVIVLEIIVYVVVRLSILGGFAGDAPHPALEGVPVGERLWVMLGLVPEFVRLFVWPARLYADYSPQAVPFLTSPALGHLPGALFLLGALALFAWAWRRDRVIAFALLWVALSLGPISNVLIATGVLVAERTLFLPSVGVLLLVARGVELAWPHIAAHPARWLRVALPTLAALLVVAGTWRSAERQLVWADNPTLFATMVVDAPTNFRAQHALGELFGAAGSWKRAEGHLRTADSLFPGYDLLELSLARVLHFDDRCPEALPLYDRVLQRRPGAEIAAIGRAACLLEARRLSDAREESLRGIGRGVSVGSFGLLLQKAESSLVATDTVDARNRWWRAGGPVSRSDARLKVPVLLMKPAASGGRRRMPEP